MPGNPSSIKVRRTPAEEDAGRVVAVLGPTNTGKTRLAVERMLGHSSGIIGLPLRLLAREVYDKVVAAKGARAAALITGEEKIVPPRPSYFVCTVEAMPMDRSAAFLAVDEIQLAADPERGHVFTDRLLHARGREETMFMGAETIRPAIRHLLDGVEFVSRPRFSRLDYAGPKKLSRLPRRSAVVAFNIEDIYSIAELIRRQRGGAALVMGALSPRTRNAQVALYEAGEVDFLVATDAIGMGLNLDVGHVAFAGLSKFDGHSRRPLRADEIAQIAGRAGRHINDGTFGVTGDAEALHPDMVEAVENHRFEPIHALQWRNGDLDFATLEALISSLQAPPPDARFVLAREQQDLSTLKALAADADLAAMAHGPAAVRLLWQVCRIPDFRKTMPDMHVRLVREIFRRLIAGDGILGGGWFADQTARLDRVDGGIDTLAGRLAHVRTWNYVANRAGWLDHPGSWRERIGAIEDRLSDALHQGLIQRFIDHRTSALMRGLRDDAPLYAAVSKEGRVSVDGHFVGTLAGFRFSADPEAGPDQRKPLRNAVKRALAVEIRARVAALAQAPDGEFRIGPSGEASRPHVFWGRAPVAALARGTSPLSPRIDLLAAELLDGAAGHRVEKRLQSWLEDQVAGLLRPLLKLSQTDRAGRELNGAARGIAFQLVEALGVLPRRAASREVRALDRQERARLKALGVRLGERHLYLAAALKPAATELRVALWAVHGNVAPAPPPPPPGLLSLPFDSALPAGYYQAAGYEVCGRRAVRVDMLDRLARAARARLRRNALAVDADLISLVGCGGEDFVAILETLGYQAENEDDRDGKPIRFRQAPRKRIGNGTPPNGTRRRKTRPPALATDPDSPFAALGALQAKGRATRTGEPAQSQRVDKWLWYCRFFKTRSTATSLCRSRKIRVNGATVAKASHLVRDGDVLTFPQGRNIRTVRVQAPGSRRGAATEARTLFEDLAPGRFGDGGDGKPRTAAGQREAGAGRPTKSERRAIDRLRGG